MCLLGTSTSEHEFCRQMDLSEVDNCKIQLGEIVVLLDNMKMMIKTSKFDIKNTRWRV